MDLKELAQYTYRGLKDRGIEVTLSGGACVSIYTRNRYQSRDLDFIRNPHDKFAAVTEAMEALGFRREGRHFVHPKSEYYVEFPPPPLSVGNEPPRELVRKKMKTRLGNLPVKMLSPTDCVKDRLCQYFYWKDRQALRQAVMVAESAGADLPELERWARQEGMLERLADFKELLPNESRKG